MMTSPSITSLLNPNSSASMGDAVDYFSDDLASAFASDSDAPTPAQPSAPQPLHPTPASPSPSPAPPTPLPQQATKKRARSNSPIPSPSELPTPPPPKHSRPTSAASSSSAPPPPAPLPAPTPTPAPAPPPQPQQQPQPQAGPIPYEPSIFNVEPIDEFTREVADWLWAFAGDLNWDVVEIEAKIGLLVDTQMRTRKELPVPIETILTDDRGLRFESNMTVGQHKHFNVLLNSRVEASASPNYPHAPVRYNHSKEIDGFHHHNGRKLRVTTNQSTGALLRVVEKTRVADMNVLSPKRGFDWRVSVNTETPGPAPPNGSQASMTRQKDRISYSHQLFQIDLTQVKSGNQPLMHELEVEFRDARALLVEGRKMQDDVPNRYLEMVQCFLNNIRMLIRNAAEP